MKMLLYFDIDFCGSMCNRELEGSVILYIEDVFSNVTNTQT